MKKILVIDDEKAIRILLSSRLKSVGYTVSQASGGNEAFKQMKEDLPDLILLDLMMPEMDGFEFLESIKSSNKAFQNIPIIVLTARAGEAELQRAIGLGAKDALKKPFDPSLLLEKVSTFIC